MNLEEWFFNQPHYFLYGDTLTPKEIIRAVSEYLEEMNDE